MYSLCRVSFFMSVTVAHSALHVNDQSALRSCYTGRMPDKAKPTSFRLPDGLRQKLALAAERQGRSVNNYVVHVLTQAVTRELAAERKSR